jgi:hypothetical protein
MDFVVLGTHSPEICPLSNAKTRALLLEIGPRIPNIAKQHGVNIVAGPFVNREHVTVVILEAERADDLDAFLKHRGSISGTSCASCPRSRWKRA